MRLENWRSLSKKASHSDAAACMVQFRKSGEPFITHPVEVTRILAELKMDPESLIAGLLHDTVEDTENVKFEEIEVMQLSCLLIMHAFQSGNLEATWPEGSFDTLLLDGVSSPSQRQLACITVHQCL